MVYLLANVGLAIFLATTPTNFYSWVAVVMIVCGSFLLWAQSDAEKDESIESVDNNKILAENTSLKFKLDAIRNKYIKLSNECAKKDNVVTGAQERERVLRISNNDLIAKVEALGRENEHLKNENERLRAENV